MKKIKIAFFADILIKDFDGASRTIFQIIERIPSNRFEFKFYCGLPPETELGHAIKSLPVVPVPLNTTYKMALPFLSQGILRSDLESFSPDVIHISSPSPLGYFAINYATKRDIPAVTIYHTHFLSYVDYYLKSLPILTSSVKSLIVNQQKRFYDSCDRVLVPTQIMVDELRQVGFRTDRMTIWERGLDTQLFNPSKNDKVYIKSIVNNDRINILFASRLVWEKNLETLIKTRATNVNYLMQQEVY